MTEKIVRELVSEACATQEVVSSSIQGGFHLVAYAHEQIILVAVGVQAQQSRNQEPTSILLARGGNLQRYGAWLPAMLKDGAWYVVRRITNVPEEGSVLSEEDLTIAKELLA
jgi:hypothetical protein